MPLAPWEPEPVLRLALESLRRQVPAPAEVVIACDGALPEPLLALLQASGLPLRRVPGPGGEGVGPVLARGLRACSHEWVLRADADDISRPQRARRQLSQLLARPELAAMSAPLPEFIRSPEAPIAQRPVPLGPALLRRRSRWRNPLNHPSVILRRSRVLAAGNYRAMPGFEDYDLWLRLLRRGPCLDNLPEPLVDARVGAAHLRRRHGLRYAARELCFLATCLREGLLPWWAVLAQVGLRLPLRLLPIALLERIMAGPLRSGPLGSGPAGPVP
ncbi:glycosyltransferase [Synechococcus sp. RSCCF101]|uniref:glycosyltransferase n=1 Tax=Synechococcus sp. RSCCF101 TaxID=2511069 RepID=UPI0012447AA9|nr:glycosyltransferase [Synechococcus sp. RSCCF101]QEY32349.1 glycosyltransferase [Synechococcus sp. RSCCF101]